MNCKNFEAVISDLAREQMLEARERESALSHVEECDGCAAMLADERALTVGLRSLAGSMERLEAPSALEANLVAKFRERTAKVQQSPVVVEMPQRATRRQRLYPHAVAAAVLLMFAIGGASMLRVRESERPRSQPNTAAAADNSNKGETQAMAVSPDNAPASVNGDDSAATLPASDDDKNGVRGQKLSRNEVDALMGATAQRRAGSQRVPRVGIGESRMTSTGGEIATDFMPVSYGDNLNEIDNGRIVRVEMPRSALAQFGLPVNMDRANERIKADVLIGDDGMARAIRFIR